METESPLLRHFEAVGEGISTEQPPLYQMVVDGNEEWHSLRDAGIVYDCGWLPISIGGLVQEEGETRSITNEERRSISDIADEWSASK